MYFVYDPQYIKMGMTECDGLIVSTRTSNKSWTIYFYDRKGDQIGYLMDTGFWEYSITDEFDNVLLAMSSSGLMIRREADDQGRITLLERPDGTIYDYQYTTNGEVSIHERPTKTDS